MARTVIVGNVRARARAALAAVALCACALGAVGCKQAVAPTGYGVDLTIDLRPLTARGSVRSLAIMASGAESYQKNFDVRAIATSSGIVQVRYVPAVAGGTLSFEAIASDATPMTLGSGKAMDVVLVAGAAVAATITLANGDVIDTPDGGADLSPSLCGNGALDPGEVDIDCGGGCSPCEPGRMCVANADCATGTCIAGHCELASNPPTWVSLPTLPSGREGAMAAGPDDGLIYVLGGFDGTTILNTTSVYNLETNAWTSGPAMADPRVWASAVTGGDAITVIGGQNSTTPTSLASIARYTPSTGTWATEARQLESARAYFGAAIGKDGRAYVAGGGAVPAVSPLDLFGSFDPAIDAPGPIMSEPAMTLARWHLGFAPDNAGRLVAIGGGGPPSGTPTARVDFFDSTTKTWSIGPALPAARVINRAVLGADGCIYSAAGRDSANLPVASVDILTQDSARWLAGPPVSVARYGAAVTRGWDGRVYVMGGGDGTAEHAEVDAYGPRVIAGPSSGAAGALIAVQGANFAANANVKVTFSGDAVGTVAGTGRTNFTGTISPSIAWIVPAVASGTYVLTVVDDRSRYPARTRFKVP